MKANRLVGLRLAAIPLIYFRNASGENDNGKLLLIV